MSQLCKASSCVATNASALLACRTPQKPTLYNCSSGLEAHNTSNTPIHATEGRRGGGGGSEKLLCFGECLCEFAKGMQQHGAAVSFLCVCFPPCTRNSSFSERIQICAATVPHDTSGHRVATPCAHVPSNAPTTSGIFMTTTTALPHCLQAPNIYPWYMGTHVPSGMPTCSMQQHRPWQQTCNMGLRHGDHNPPPPLLQEQH